jgi:hypothetical protein
MVAGFGSEFDAVMAAPSAGVVRDSSFQGSSRAMNKQKPPVPKALEGGARSRRLRAQAGYKSQVLHVITVADDPRFVKWPLVPSAFLDTRP